MKNVSKFDKATLKALRDEMQAVLNKFGANLEFEVGNMRFSDAEVEIKVSAKIKGATTMVDRILQMEADRLGLVMENKSGDKLVSYKTRAQKYSFVYSTPDGKMFKTDERGVKARFGQLQAA